MRFGAHCHPGGREFASRRSSHLINTADYVIIPTFALADRQITPFFLKASRAR